MSPRRKRPATAIVRHESFGSFEDRMRKHARRVDQGQRLPNQVGVSVPDFSTWWKILSLPRRRLLQAVLVEPQSIPALMRSLQRSRRSLQRDISLLNQVGLISILIVPSPGRGPRKLIWAIAARIDLQARMG